MAGPWLERTGRLIEAGLQRRRWPRSVHGLSGQAISSFCAFHGECERSGRRKHGSVFFLFFFKASYGGSQARGRIRATAAGLRLSHSNTDQSCVCELHHSSWHRWIPNSLREARDQTRTFMGTSRVRFRCTTTGTPGVCLTSWLLKLVQ